MVYKVSLNDFNKQLNKSYKTLFKCYKMFTV